MFSLTSTPPIFRSWRQKVYDFDHVGSYFELCKGKQGERIKVRLIAVYNSRVYSGRMTEDKSDSLDLASSFGDDGSGGRETRHDF